MQRKAIHTVCFLLCVCLLLSFSGCTTMITQQKVVPEKYQALDTEYDKEIKKTSEFYTVAENDNFRLDILRRCTEIRVTDKRTGRQWFSNPQSRYGGTEGNVARISSQVLVQYTMNDSPATYSSYGDAVSNSQYSFSQIENGIRVNYRMGEFRRDYIVPQVLSIERYEEVMAGLDEDDQVALGQYYELISVHDESMDKESKTLILDKFPILAYRDCYITQLRTTAADSDLSLPFASDYLMEKMEGLFIKAGYTADMLAEDNEKNQVNKAMFPDYSVSLSVEYTIDEDGLSVRVPQDSIAFDASLIKLTQISLLPYFGAADTSQEGYIFVPDGSGALINLNNGKTNMSAYSKRVYGRDMTLPKQENAATGVEQIYLPVFGIKTVDSAFLGVIESGAAIAYINADISGKGSAFNTVGATFEVNSSQSPQTHSLNTQDSKYYQEQIAQCDCSIRYSFLYNEQANYTGMALEYQRYLIKNGLLNDATENSDALLYLDILQAVDAKQQVLGVPIQRPLALTTCEQALTMLEELKQMGVSAVDVQLTGWSNNGVNNTVMNKVRWMRMLGGRKGFTELGAYVRGEGNRLYTSCNFQYVGKNASLDGYTENKHASRTLENVAAKGVVSPRQYLKLANGFTKGFAADLCDGMALTWMGTELNGDYRSEKMIDRQAASGLVVETLNGLRDKGFALSVDGGNAYTLGAVSFLSGVSLNSSMNNLFDESVPFYEIVVHGYLSCSSRPLNQVSDYEGTVLKLLETGTIPSFLWMYADNTALKETEYSNYFSVHYGNWVQRAATVYAQVKETIGDCLDSRIVSHSRVAGEVYLTVYENSVKIYVNYGNAPVTVDGIEVPARGYQRVKGGAQ